MYRYFFRSMIPFIFLFIFFCIDLWIFFGLNQHASFLTIGFCMAILFDHPLPLGQLLWGFLLIESSALIVGLPLWWPLLTVLPIALAILLIRNHIFANQLLHAAIGTAICLSADLLFLRPFLLNTTPATSYTIGIICANIGITMLFSLKLKTGKIRQSLTLA